MLQKFVQRTILQKDASNIFGIRQSEPIPMVNDPYQGMIAIQIGNIAISVAVAVAIVAILALWITMVIQIIKRKDLKEQKVLWVLLLLFAGPIGMIAYPFVEHQKKLGIITIIAYSIPIVVMILYAIFRMIFIPII